MAFHILKNLRASGLVYNLELSVDGKVEKCDNAKVSGISKEANGLRFSLHEYSLPFPILKSDYGFSQLVPFQQELNQQIIKVKDLEVGVYMLSIDGTKVGKFSSKELSDGVNLSGNQNTPQFKLAMSIRDKVLFKKAVLEQRVRVVRNNLRFVLKEIKGINWSEPNSILTGIVKFKNLKAKRGERIQGWQAYLISTAEYTLPRLQETMQELKSIRQKLAKMPKEKVYEYLIKKVD